MSEENKRPIEIGFPIQKVNELAEKEKSAEMHYRPSLTMHKWWARRAGTVFRTILLYSLTDESDLSDVKIDEDDSIFKFLDNSIWQRYYRDVKFEDTTILDPFMGGGTTLIEALRMNCDVIGCDINPVPWFITKQAITPIDIDQLEEKYVELKESIGEEIRDYYRTKCSNSSCKEKASVMYTFWAKKLTCPNCKDEVPLHKDWKIARFKNGNDYVHCPSCGEIVETEDYNSQTSCPSCSENFDPNNGYVSGKKFNCPECGQPYGIIDRINEIGKPEQEMFAIEYYCSECDEKGYKKPGKDDLELYEKAKNELKDNFEDLPIPTQSIPVGLKTRELLNHGYEKFNDMFNDRELYLAGKLLSKIKKIENQKIKEFFLLIFSNTLDFYNEFCIYNKGGHKIEHLFMKRAYVNRTTYVENNLWGAEYGRGTFTNQYELIKKGKEYLKEPFDRFIDNDGESHVRKIGDEIETNLVESFEDFHDEGQNALLLNKSSENLPEIPENGTIDAVITDPPYYQNIQYSELSDFFYVWLRLALKDKYENFEPSLTDKEKETVVNKVRGKSEEDFENELTNLFSEAKSKLKEKGLLVFTFSHKAGEAWSKVLKSVLQSGFIVEASYPVLSESKSGTRDPNNIDFDTIVVCKQKPKENPKTIPWSILEDEIYEKASSIAKEYKEKNGKALSLADMIVVTQGVCFEAYSKYYPNVVEDGEEVEVEEAVNRVSDVVGSQLIEERLKGIANKTDKKTAFYSLLLAGREKISNDDFRKELRGSGLEVEDFIEDKLLKQNKKLHVIFPINRAEYVKGKRETTALDKAHYLLYLYKSDDKSIFEEGDEWIDYKSVEALSALEVESSDSDIKKVKEYAEERVSTKSEKELEQEKLDEW